MSGPASVAVVGGGVAGAAACIALGRAGLSPLWIAPTDDRERPGEHLAPAARPLLAGLGAEDLLAKPCHRPANATFSAWGCGRLRARPAMVHLEGPATVLDRRAFERDLAAAAVAAGAARHDVPLDRAERETGLWRLHAGGRVHRSRFVIDATGRTAAVASRLAQRFRDGRLAALHVVLDQDAASDVVATPATLIEAVEQGWWYAALLADGRLALNHFSDPDLLPAHATRSSGPLRALLERTEHVGRWVQEARFLADRPPRLASAATAWLAPVAGDGWAAAGDAAAAFDPLSSHGMTTALWTATRAAGAALAALQGDGAPLGRYAAEVAAGVQRFLDSGRQVYRQEQRFAGSPFWQRRHGATVAA